MEVTAEKHKNKFDPILNLFRTNYWCAIINLWSNSSIYWYFYTWYLILLNFLLGDKKHESRSVVTNLFSTLRTWWYYEVSSTGEKVYLEC